MIKKTISLLFVLTSFIISNYGQINESRSYDELVDLALEYFHNDKADSSIIVMEYAQEKFPENFGSSSTILAQIHTRTGNFPQAIEIWEIGLEKGFTYGLNSGNYQKYYKDNVAFERIAKLEKSRLDTIHLKYEILLPTGYQDKKNYPILFIFHGNNRNIGKSKKVWNSPVLTAEFITVYLQSYIPSNSTDFKWIPNDDKIKKEFKEIYDQIMKIYSVDESKIIFAGMSAGGRKALEFTMNNDFPFTGLVLNCPVILTDISDDMLTDFVKENKKMGIITGENDFALENQQSLINAIEKHAGQSRITVNEGLGHEFPENFSQFLDEYLSWLIE